MLSATCDTSAAGLGTTVLVVTGLALIAGTVCLAADRQETGKSGKAPVCEMYAPGHFGNWYECAGIFEMRDVLAEAKHWGFNRYSDWFDMIDCADPFDNDHQYDLGNALWDRKKAHFKSAQALGLPCNLLITPNHVYYNQLRPDWLAKRKKRIFGQLICPSIPGAREAILKNYENLLKDLRSAGIRLAGVAFGPYDYGGCACEKCKPWIKTYAALSYEIYRIAQKYHPGVEMHHIGWWWSKSEHEIFAKWADAEAPGVVKSIALHILYGQTTVSDVPLPKGCERRAFVHISYADKAKPRDMYGHFGPLIAPNRLAKTVADLRKQGVVGVMAYCEGVFEDVNKALLAGMFMGDYETADAVLVDYAKRYFGADASQAKRWADWLADWGDPFARDATAALREMETLPGERMDWRRRQWELKAQMFQAHQEIMKRRSWTPERLAYADAFLAAREECHRRVWGLGPQRHIFSRRFLPVSWYGSWAKHQAEAAAKIGKEQ
jgi:hypothetical protein